MADTFLYLTTKGRISGEPRLIEIWFVELEGRHYLVSEKREESRWVKNVMADAKVSFSVGTRDDHGAPREATARLVRPESEPDLCARVSSLMDKKYDWSDGLIVELSPR